MAREKIVKQLREFSKQVKSHGGFTVTIPENDFGIVRGVYEAEKLSNLLYFIADMLE